MNPEDDKEPRLPEEAEELLENWPIAERDDSDWESLALQIDARIEQTPLGSTDSALLMAPLPQSGEDEIQPERRSHPRVKRPSDGGLAALAKATMLVRDESQQKDLARQTLDVARRARRKGRPARVVAPAAAVEPSEPRRTSRVAWASMTFGVLGVAAALVMYVSTRQPAPVALAPTEVTEAATPVAQPGVSEMQAREVADEPTPALRVEEVPLAEPEKSAVALAPRRAAAAKPAPAAKAAKPSEGAKPATPPPSAGPSEAGMVMADGRGGIADRPSPGAIQAAVGSVMGPARACAAGLSGVSRAAVTFGSNGQVLSVSVSGPAQGTGAEACIQTALGRARVQPFARSSYTVRLSVRSE